MDTGTGQYGLRWVAALNAAIFIVFAFSFVKPPNRRARRSFGTFSAFLLTPRFFPQTNPVGRAGHASAAGRRERNSSN